jgi:hypothetical protein
MIEAIRQEIRQRLPAPAATSAPSMLQIGGASWRGGRVHFAIFASEASPALYARMMRNPRDDEQLVREYELLQMLAASEAFRDHVPEPLFLTKLEDRTVLCERAVTGSSLRSQASGLGERSPLTIATDLAVALARASMREIEPAELRARTLAPLAEIWLGSGGSKSAIESLFDQVITAFGGRPRCVVTHGDFIAKNILVDRGRGSAAVIDWETAARHGLPLVDLLYFVTRSAYVDGAFWRDKPSRVSALYYSRSARGATAARAVRRYLDALELPHALITPLFRLHFLLKARIKAETTSFDNPITRLWLDLFAESLDREPSALLG